MDGGTIMEIITVKCKTKNCFNYGVEIEVPLSHVICGICNSVLNEMLSNSNQPTEAEQAGAKAALLAKLGITADEAQLLLGGN